MFIFFNLNYIIIYSMKRKALFLDRDGIINIDKKYVYKIQDFEFCDGIFELCRYFLAQKYLLFVATNQSGIARG
ncbi:D,D-heptose 1,7-bisphosphate phosphatase, partial [Campylobacter coli]|nr:D,D-heptose 1,7-bisphosphate phosphatase [Campylobacter coli]